MALQDLLNPFFKELDAQNLTYCVCGNYKDLPEYTSHDVDIWSEDTQKIEKILFEVAERRGFTLYLHNKTANGANTFFYKIAAGEENIEFIGIDILNECVWLPFIPIVKAGRIKEEIIRYKNFYAAGPVVETCMHFLFSLIHHGKIREKYKERIYEYHTNRRFCDLVSEAFGDRTAGTIIDQIRQKNWSAIERHVRTYRLNLLLGTILNVNVKTVKYFIEFVRTNVHRIFNPSGLFITFIGCDGAGKTTIIDRLDSFFNNGFLRGKNRKEYWRPFLLPLLKDLLPVRKKSDNNESYDKRIREFTLTPRNAVLSAVKFFYYFVDTIIGRVKYQKEWSRGGVVCFDRYYFDNIVNPQRFAFIMPRYVMEFLKNFIPKPDLTFYLYSPPEILKERKDEYPLHEIEQQVEGYNNLIQKLANGYRINTTYPINKVANKIIRICIEHMAERIAKQGLTDRRFCGWQYLVNPAESELMVNGKLREKVDSCFSKYDYRNISVHTMADNSSLCGRDIRDAVDVCAADFLCLLVSSRMPLFMLKRELAKSNLEYVYSYILLPSFNYARLFLPLSRRLIRESSKVLRPTKFKSLMAMKLLCFLNAVSYPQLLFPSQMIMTRKKASKLMMNGMLKDYVSRKLGREDIDFILYTGASGIYQKFTAQVMDKDGNILAYAKIGHTEQAKERIRHEINTIRYLKTQHLSTLEVPDIISAEQMENLPDFLLLQTPPPDEYSRWSDKLTDKHISSLVELFLETRKNVNGQSIINELRKELESLNEFLIVDNYGVRSVLDRSIRELEQVIGNKELSLGFSQGDFIPWNIYLGYTRLFVFDWEVSRHRVPMWDIFYFVLYTEVIANSRDDTEILQLLTDRNGVYSVFKKQFQSSLEQTMFFDETIFLVITLCEIILFYVKYCSDQSVLTYESDVTAARLLKAASSILRGLIKGEGPAL